MKSWQYIYYFCFSKQNLWYAIFKKYASGGSIISFPEKYESATFDY